jgi:hypothetical protein
MISKKDVSDDMNPRFIFQGIKTQLLVELLAKDTDLHQLIIDELRNRGLDPHGKYIG